MIEQGRTEYRPRTVSPPGRTLADMLEELQISQRELAERMGRPPKTINEIVKGKTAIVSDTALQLERVLGTPADFWLRREARYREFLARREDEGRLKGFTTWLKELPIRDMAKFGWIAPGANKAQTVGVCLRYFGVASVDAWRARYPLMAAAFRASKRVRPSPGAIAAWLRRGEIEAARQSCGPANTGELRKALRDLRALTLVAEPASFVPELQRACARYGVAVVFIPAPKGCPVSGATRWLSSEKAVVQLSLRHKSNDHLWFTFFHEMAHIILHGKRLVFLEGDGGDNPALEGEADAFARDLLIPPEAAARLREVSRSTAAVERYARELGIAPGIVVGRLQNERIIDWSHMNELKIFYNWAVSDSAAEGSESP